MTNKEIATDTFFLGSFGMPKTISLYLVKGVEPALIDSGPSSISDRVCDRLSELGVPPEDVSYILLTHIHVDHAGGAWALLERMPEARVMLHSDGVGSLVDPSTRYFPPSKTLDDLLKKWGEVKPVSPSRILEAKDGQTLNLGGLELKFLDAPGHAPHQIAIYDAANHVLFPGDAMGIYYPGIDVVTPASIPHFDLDATLQTLQKLSSLRVDMLCLPHYGPVLDVKPFFQRVIQTYRKWGEIISEYSGRHSDLDQLASRIAQEFSGYSTLMRDPLGVGVLQLSISGYVDYFQRKMRERQLMK